MQDLTKLVLSILLMNKETRNSDNKLYLEVINSILINGSKRSIEDIFLNYKEYGIPPYESISRARRKVQELRKDLRGEEEITERRKQKEKEFNDFFARKKELL